MGNQGHAQVIKGAFFLSLAALIAKVLSAVYRIPYQNIAGDFGFYVYQQIYPFYGMMTILALYGFPVVISRQIAEKKAQGLHQEAREVLFQAFVGLMIFSIIVCLLFFLFAGKLAVFMGDEALAPLLRLVAIGFLFLPVLSVYRGAGQGNEHMGPTAFSHVGEQLVRVVTIIVATYLLVEIGSGPYEVGKGAIYGSLLGSVVGCLIVVTMSWTKRSNQKVAVNPSMRKLLFSNALLFKQSIFVCLNALVLLLFQLVDVFTVVRFLQESGMAEQQAYLAKGVYDRGQPLIQLGTILTTTVALALVPLLAKSLATRQFRDARMFRDAALRLAVLIGGGASIGLVVLMGSINHMLFTDQAGTGVLQVFAMSILPCSVYMSAAAILQGYGRMHVPVYAIILGLVIKIAGNAIFITIFQTAMGAALANLMAFTVMMVFVLYAIKQMDDVLFVQKSAYVAVVVTLFFLGLIAYLIREMGMGLFAEPQTRFQATVIALLVSLAGGMFVFVAVFFSNILTKREWASVPKLMKWRRALINCIKRE